MAEFITSTWGREREHIKVLNPLEAFIDNIIRSKRRSKANVQAVGRRVFYKPSQEYQDYLITLKKKR